MATLTCPHCGAKIRDHDPEWAASLSSQRCPNCGRIGSFSVASIAVADAREEMAHNLKRARHGGLITVAVIVSAAAFALYLSFGAVTPCGILKNRMFTTVARNDQSDGLDSVVEPLVNPAIDQMSPAQCINGLFRLHDYNGSLTFRVAGLEWQRNAPHERTSLDDATDYCANLVLDGPGWRLPSQEDLFSLYRALHTDSEISTIPGLSPRSYWSSSRNDRDVSIFVPFDQPSSAKDVIVTGNHYVRCVR